MQRRIFAFVRQLRNEYYGSRQTILALRVTVIALTLALVLTKRTFWTPDTLFAVLLAVAVVFGKTRAFMVRFLPLVSWLLLYEVFRGIADEVNRTVHFWEMIHFDRWMFAGALPTSVLQQWWWSGAPGWHDFYFYFLYTIHFLMPFVLALLIWKYRSELYWRFVVALVGLSFAAFTTYILFPAAPPWMASELGYFSDPMVRISSSVWATMGIENFSQIYANLPTNPVAAVPSLHSAYPLLFSMYVIRVFGFRRTGWVLLYPFSMWLGVVYLGEHYVFDVIAGALFAVGAYYATERYFAWHNRPRQVMQRLWRHARARMGEIARRYE